MKVDVKEATLASIHNPDLRAYAEQYVRIYQDFMDQVRQTGLEIDSGDEQAQFAATVTALQKKGAQAATLPRVFTSSASLPLARPARPAWRVTPFHFVEVHRDCFYCFNPNQEDYQYYREHTRDTVAELHALRASGARVRHLALTGGEPLLQKDETIRFFQQARLSFPGVYTRLYTCGDHIDRPTLQALKDSGMNEIRFSIRMQDLARGQRHTFEQIALAREYIPHVMVEMPVLPARWRK